MIANTRNEVALTPELKEMYQVIDACKDNPDEFKFNVEDIWRPMGYSRIDSAVYQVKKMVKGVDYEFSTGQTSRKGGRPRKIYLLSSEGFKKLLASCGTPLASKYHDYLIQAETTYRKHESMIPEDDRKLVDQAFDAFVNTPLNDRISPEAVIRDRLANELHGETEVPVEHGRVDVVTKDECIEVKVGHDWKHALGQVLVYSQSASMSKKRKRIHLFDVDNVDVGSVKRICHKYNIVVTTE